MFTPGKLLYFDPFYFKDGGSKSKYFLVLHVAGNNIVLAGLPSSKVHLPANQSINHGCLDDAPSGINCYIFEASWPITQCGWSFPLTTFLYGMWLDEFDTNILNANHPIRGVDYEEIGTLTPEELQQVIACFRSSAAVKRKFKRMLGGL